MEPNNNMAKPQSRYNWLSMVVGIICIIVGIWCLQTPDSTLASLTILFILSFFALGGFDIGLAIRNMKSGQAGWRLAIGIIDILLGFWLCAMPAAQVAVVLVYVVGFYIFFTSCAGISESVQLKKMGFKGWGWLMFFSILCVISSFLFVLSPLFGGIALVWMVGIAFISYGCFRFMLPA